MRQQAPRFTSSSFKAPPQQQAPESSSLQPSPQPPLPPSPFDAPISAPTLPEVPPNYEPEDLTIHIDASGQKRLVNARGEESMISPMSNKYFGDYERRDGDAVGTHNRQAAIEKAKQQFARSYKVSPQSRIYNYHGREVLLLGQLYQSLVGEKEKQEIIGEYSRLKSRAFEGKVLLLGYTVYLATTHRASWSRLTANNFARISLLAFLGVSWGASAAGLRAFQSRSVLEHSKAYENIIETYEKDYKIVY